ncbi:MAG: cell wall hydrolase [Lachnospiraceae bacterium]|nr:cell wall hydrolase [Lachnospiraceae bacterium]
MSKRTKLKLQNLRVYLKKNVFNGRYMVRNILAVTIMLTFVIAVYGAGSLISENKKNGEALDTKTADSEIQEEIIAIDVKSTSKLNAASIDILMADMDAGSDVDVEAKETEMLTEAYKEFADKCVAVADNVNVRENADTDSKIVGKMNNGAVAVVNSTEGEWINITSGDVTGYVKSEFVKTGNDAFDYAKDFYSVTGKVTEDGVNIREDATTSSDVIAAAYTGVTYEVDKEATDAVDGWVCIAVDSTNKGYINADYIEVTEGYPVASAYNDVSSKNEEKNADNDETTEKKSDNKESSSDKTEKKEDTVKQDNKTEVDTKTTETVTTETQTTEATTEITTEAEIADNQTTVAVTARGSIALSEEDIYLMAAVMTLECGNEPYDGQLAVANVILNRLQSGRWGSTMSGVVYAPSQFTVVNSPSFNTYISPSCLQAAREACAGTNNIGGYMSFRPLYNIDTSSLGSYTIIGNHCFF